ncbi:MAG: O-antigen ligase family protein [Candidatus Dormibacteraceae bacterium]
MNAIWQAAIKSDRWQPLATWLMALALACSPSYLLRGHLLGLPTNGLEIVLGVAIVVGLFAYRFELDWHNPYRWPALLLLLAATLDMVLSPNRRGAMGIWAAYFLEPMLAGLVCAAIARQTNRARLLLAGLAVSGGIIALANLVVTVPAYVSGHFNVFTPPVAIYQSANAVPLYLEPLIAFALPLALWSRPRIDRLAAGAFALIAVLACLTSYSRAGWLTVLVLVVAVSLFSRLRWWIIAGLSAVGALLFAFSHSIRSRILVEFDLHSRFNTIGLRIDLWKSSLNMLRHHPLLGGGLAGFKESLRPYHDAGFHEDLIYPHNLFLNFWSETGLLGLAAIVWLLIQMLRLVRRGLVSAPESSWPRLMSIGLLGLVLAFLVHGLVDVPYFKNDQALACFALIGIQLASLRGTKLKIAG